MTHSTQDFQEWTAVQLEYSQYEKYAIWLKILAVLLSFISLTIAVDLLMVGVILALLWIQEAILRTSQHRISTYLMSVEAQYRDAATGKTTTPFQLHTNWAASRGSNTGLLIEYGANAFRPTVAFPYLALIILLFANLP